MMRTNDDGEPDRERRETRRCLLVTYYYDGRHTPTLDRDEEQPDDLLLAVFVYPPEPH